MKKKQSADSIKEISNNTEHLKGDVPTGNIAD